MSQYDLSRAVWRKSSHSGQNGSCVEAAAIPSDMGHGQVIAVRDSKDPDGPSLILPPGQWHAFTARVKQGQFDPT
jgi:Domain of unknown function (DUF397)